MERSTNAAEARLAGRYALHAEIAAGGMATVHVGRLLGPGGFSRTVAIKRLHAQFAKDPEFVSMFMDEARLAARIQHPNVVSIIDVVAERGELLLVMDYIAGQSLSRLLRSEQKAGRRVEPRILVKIMTEVLSGLHAAHELTDERGAQLGVVHRDVSPQNILVGADGVAHLIDFGVAKAAGRLQTTRKGHLKGKLAYMPPEQIRFGELDRRTDIYAASVVLWQGLVGRQLFSGGEANVMYAVLSSEVKRPGSLVPGLPAGLDDIVMKGLARDPDDRFSTALEMADALEGALAPASTRETARWMQKVAGDELERRARVVSGIESATPSMVSTEIEFGASLSGVERSAPTLLDTPQSHSSPEASSARSASGVQAGHPRIRRALLLAAGGLAIGLIAAALLGSRQDRGPALSATAPGSSSPAVAEARSSAPLAASGPVASSLPEKPPAAEPSAAPAATSAALRLRRRTPRKEPGRTTGLTPAARKKKYGW